MEQDARAASGQQEATMKFDEALIRDVHDRAPEGTAFTEGRVKGALQWAVDLRAAGGPPPGDHLYRNTAVGRAALAALTDYKPPAPEPPSAVQVVVRAVAAGLVWNVLTLVLILAVRLVAEIAGDGFDTHVTGWAFLAGWAAWSGFVWLLRDRLGLTRPVAGQFTHPAASSRGTGRDPIATTMSDPELRLDTQEDHRTPRAS